MFEKYAFNVALTLLSVALGIVGGVLIGVVCVVLALAILVALWTPARSWLDIPAMSMSGEGRIGYIGREGSFGNLRKAKFGKDLDTGIDPASAAFLSSHRAPGTSHEAGKPGRQGSRGDAGEPRGRLRWASPSGRCKSAHGDFAPSGSPVAFALRKRATEGGHDEAHHGYGVGGSGRTRDDGGNGGGRRYRTESNAAHRGGTVEKRRTDRRV
jgi:hypothetical protein